MSETLKQRDKKSADKKITREKWTWHGSKLQIDKKESLLLLIE